MIAEPKGGNQQAALRAVYKSYPAEELQVLHDGKVEITTTRPSFWEDRQGALTWGDYLNALVVRVGRETAEVREKRRELEEAWKEADDVVVRAQNDLIEAKAAWEATKSPEAAVAMAEGHDRVRAAEVEQEKARIATGRASGQRVAAAHELIRFLEDIAWDVGDVDLSDEYGRCDC